MCKTQIFTFSTCPHRLQSGEVEPCEKITDPNQPLCDPVTEEESSIGKLCYDCVEAEHTNKQTDEDEELNRILAQSQESHQAELETRSQAADEEAEFQRILELSQQTFEQDQDRISGPSQEEQDELDRILKESAEMDQPPARGADFDEAELAQIMALSLQEHETSSNKPKNYLRLRARFACGHETEQGITDIEFDPMSEGLPYLLSDERSRCPDCGGSSSSAPAGHEVVPSMPAASVRHSIEDELELSENEGFTAGFDLNNRGKAPAYAAPSTSPPEWAPQGEESIVRSPTPLPDWTSADDCTGAHPEDPLQLPTSPPPGFEPRRSAPPAPSASTPPLYDAPPPASPSPPPAETGPSAIPTAEDGTPLTDDQIMRNKLAEIYKDDEEDSDEELDIPVYATVDNLALEGMLGAQREAKEREERNRIERLRYEGAMAAQDAEGDDQ